MPSDVLYCSACKEELEAAWDICPSCETPTRAASGPTCTSCGRAIKPGWKKCPYCKMATTSARSSDASAIEHDAEDGVFLTHLAGAGEQGTLATVIPPGAQLDKYRIKSPLGSGGFGAVFLAEDTTLREDIALKVVRVSDSHASERALQALLQEFRVRSRIRDTTHIVMGQDPRPVQYNGLALLLLPMELASGGTFRAWLRVPGRPIPDRLREGIQRFREICRGVTAIHEAGLVHLDLKPENVLLTDAGAKIADFGLGRFAGTAQSGQPDDQLLREGIGTPQYMSPEQFSIARQKDIGPTSDVYSLGVMLYELLDGDLPFDGVNMAELREKHLNSPPTPFRDPTLRETWWRVVARCLQKAQDTRYQTAAILLKDFERALLGAAFVVDVSCPSCAHINANPNARTCERCNNDLSGLFQACPRCGKMVRKDVERCVGCGADVAGHYLALELNRQVATLQDEDVEEAIAILEQLVQRVSSDETLSWLKGLRKKQEEIVECIESGQRHERKGEAEAAIKDWRRVLRLAPRHRYALSEIARLEGVRDQYTQSVRQAMAAADAGDFPAAIAQLNAALPMLPEREEGRKLLAELHARSQHYENALREARQAQLQKQRKSQKHFAERAFAEASQSQVARALLEEAARAVTEAQRQLEKGRGDMRKALWSDATAVLTNIGASSADHVEAATLLLREIGHKQVQYAPLLESARAAAAERRVGAVASLVSQLFALAPDDPVSRTLDSEASEATARVEACLAATKQPVLAGDFPAAFRSLDAAQELWPDHGPTQFRRAEVVGIKREYDAAMLDARSAAKVGFPRHALPHFEKAKRLCPKSAEVTSELTAANDAIARARRLGQEAESSVRGAAFAQAAQHVKSALAHDSEEEIANRLSNTLGTMQKQFEEGLVAARSLFAQGNLDDADQRVAAMQEHFPLAVDLQNLTREVAEARAQRVAAAASAAAEARARQARLIRTAKFVGLATLAVAAFFGLYTQLSVNSAVKRALSRDDLVAAAQTIERKGGTAKLNQSVSVQYGAAADEWMTGALRQWYESGTAPGSGWQAAAMISRQAASLGGVDRTARERYFAGQASFDANRWNEAEQAFRSAASSTTDRTLGALAQNGIGKACVRANRISCAIDAYLSAINVAPGWIYPMQNLAGVYLNVGRLSDAERQYLAVLQMDANRGVSRYGLGEVYFEQRRFRAAREQYQIALQSPGLDPSQATEARNRLATLRRRGY